VYCARLVIREPERIWSWLPLNWLDGRKGCSQEHISLIINNFTTPSRVSKWVKKWQRFVSDLLPACGRKIKCSRSRAMLLALPVGLDLVGFVWSVERIVTLSILYALYKISYSPRESEGVCISPALVCCLSVCVCLSLTTITITIVDGFVQNFMERFPGVREDHVRVSLRSVEGCVSNGQKTP